ncbi:hypothetical protein EDD80_102379 [Anseongella ginsenosidimutans]|uniref:Uncharacterized protein n=1 Tax=Anseongella ginsenosidimutans TaxID=496056 RepID=A0A4R3KV45_9SPHI|nr:hypothetical protein [Anseongella ginsenosidimutans]QEC51814.1 hypothetical protein FRZ59_05315 [Anseongella ginsenosidimutans]TCS89185.1 hypothetical protein EDD80_102379 [Anseongella ginsenosidimutans]
MKKTREDQLWDYAEGRLSGPEKAELEQWLEADPRNRKQLEELSVLSHALSSMEPEVPSMRFTARVMEAWDQELAFRASPLQTRTDKRIVYGVAAFLGGALLFTLGLLFVFSGGSALFSGGSGSPVEERWLSGISSSLGSLFEGLGHYFIGLIALLLMLLVERYVHYRQYIRSVE